MWNLSVESLHVITGERVSDHIVYTWDMFTSKTDVIQCTEKIQASGQMH